MEEVANGDAEHAATSIKPEQFFILLPLALSVLLMVISFLKRRSQRDVLVNCWFCNQNVKVPRGNANCFDCTFCEQYNGFKEDGDYNKPIPAQYNEDLNYPITGGLPKHAPGQSWSNGLCSQCNHNQAIKVKLTAAFEPVLPNNEDDELKAYVAHLENLYRLCWRCQVQVRTTLEQQNAELAKYLPDPPTRPTESISEVPKKAVKEKVVQFAVFLGEFLCFFASAFIVCVHMHSSWFPLWFSRLHPFLQVIQNVKLPFVELEGHSASICLASLFMTFVTTGLDKAQKGMVSFVARLALWGLLLLYSQTSYPVLTSYLSTAIFPGDKFSASVLLSSFSFITLWKSLTARHKQHRIQKRNLKKSANVDGKDGTLKSSSVADWIAACNDQQDPARCSSSEGSSRESRIFGPSLLPKRLQLSQSFDQLHISLSKQCIPSRPRAGFQFTVVHNYQKYGKSFSDAGYPNQYRPLLRPAQFFPKHSISKSSWVAGGLWLPPGGDKPKVETVFSASPSLLTPPPSLDGSQTSQPGSTFNEAFASGKSVFEDCGRSWPPSHASLRRRSSPHSSTPQSSELRAEPKPSVTENKYRWPRLQRDCWPRLKRGVIVLSVCCNLLAIVHFIWRQTQVVR